MMRFVVVLVLISLFYSCQESNKGEEDKYQIISLFYQKLAKPKKLTYNPNNINKRIAKIDSIRIDSLNNLTRKKWRKRKFITAVYPEWVPYTGDHYKYFSNKCSGYDEIMDKLMKLKDSSQIDLLKITSGKRDSIIPFSNNLIVKESKDFIRFDLLITFSPISFDKDYNRAIVVVTEMRSKIEGTTDLFMMEKIDNQWGVYCKINLGIY